MSERQLVNPANLNFIPCVLPRPGEEVVWYLDCLPQSGILVGHGPGGKPIVQNRNGFTYSLDSYDQLRIKSPSSRLGPNWLRLDARTHIVRPYVAERDEFTRILTQHIPPGPTYLELIQEIWQRGFEVFLVGGTVRDVISGIHTNDVDVVTSMPLSRALPLLTSMYRHEPTVSEKNGFVRLGGTPASGDPFIDLKSFIYSDPGTPNAVFGSDFAYDLHHRDFACNAIYYDPINEVLVDPCGEGILGAEKRVLDLVCDHTIRPPYNRAQVVVRFFKFRMRGYYPTESTASSIRDNFMPALASMSHASMMSYVGAQIWNKIPAPARQKEITRLEEVMLEFGAEEAWRLHMQPVVDSLMGGG